MSKVGDSERHNTFIHSDKITLRQIIESPKDIIMFSLDTSYRYTSFSKAHKDTMLKIWGKEICLGCSIMDAMTVEKDREKAKANFDKVLKGESLVIREEYGEVGKSRKYWEDRYYPIEEADCSISGLTVFVTDVTPQVQNEESLRKALVEKELLLERELLINSVGEGLYGVDMDGKSMFVNPAALSMLGYTEEEFIGQNTHRLIHHHHYDGKPYAKEDCIIHAVSSSEQREETRTWLFRKCGEMFPVRIIASPIMRDREIAGIVVAFSDISMQFDMEERLKNTNNELKVLATQDHLTEIYNRRYFEERGSGLFAGAKVGGQPLSMIMFDIDFFKKINDRYGHSVGDLVLIMVTETVKTQLRKSDIFARIGGEEFAIVLPEIGLIKGIEIAERIRQKVEQASITQNGEEIRCTISVGVADVAGSDEDIYALLKRADDRQYHAKKTGRNRVVSSD